MKRTKISFVGEKPIFTGSPQIVPGGFNLDREKQRFSVGDIIPAGTLAIFDEVTRKVQIVKTAKVKAIGTRIRKLSLCIQMAIVPPAFLLEISYYKLNPLVELLKMLLLLCLLKSLVCQTLRM